MNKHCTETVADEQSNDGVKHRDGAARTSTPAAATAAMGDDLITAGHTDVAILVRLHALCQHLDKISKTEMHSAWREEPRDCLLIV